MGYNYTERKGFAVTLWYGGAFASTLDFQFCHDNPSKKSHQKGIQVVVSNISYFHSYLGTWSSLTNMFQMGCFNHQLGKFQELVNFSSGQRVLARGWDAYWSIDPSKEGFGRRSAGAEAQRLQWSGQGCHGVTFFYKLGQKKSPVISVG